MKRRTAPAPSPRPSRGTPAETRDRLVRAAAEIFNRDGYDGTDSNRIAREAGYAPGTFYKHFTDKRQVFLAVYAEWVAREWREVSATIGAGGSVRACAETIVDVFLAHHRRWRRFRGSLRALVTTDPEVRDFYRAQRRRQIELLATSRPDDGDTHEHDALLLFTLERTADAIADGEPESLRIRVSVLRGLLVDLVAARLTQKS